MPMTLSVHRVTPETGQRVELLEPTEYEGAPTRGFLANPVAFPPCRCPRGDCPDRAAA